LSKRKDVYIQGTYIKVARASGVDGTGLEFAANADAAAPSSSSKQFMARVGIRQQF
jgi:predicted porin